MTGLPFDRLEEVDDLLDRALDLPEDEREGFLDRECPEPEIRSAVEGLIWAEATSRKLFDGSDAGSWLGWENERASGTPLVGDQIRDYRLVEVLGVGGSSTVFRAERIQGGFEQEVALKVLDASSLSAGAMERFRLERQILAGLEHPSIARLLGGGVTDGGRPYIVMEYVDGVPIDRYCDHHRLTVSDRVELLRTVCGAVQAANQKLIVHRDLKPANVMVTREGRVKLLDFGIAKLLDPGDESELGVDTQTGVHPMTPAYASPEQALGLPITTATDVYQLGLLLYELLCGRRPRTGSTRSLDEIREWLGQQAVQPPSRTLRRGLGASVANGTDDNGQATPPEEIARRRRTHVDRLHSKLRGDLDQIAIKALQVEADARYGSVAELEADLGRYLAARPIRARPPALGYRIRKFLARHRVGSTLSVAALAIIAYLGTGLVRQYRATVIERDKAQAISDYMTGMFTRANPWQGARDTLSAIALLEEGAVRLDSDLAGEPLVRAAMSESIGRAFSGLGDWQRAGPLVDTALAIRRRVLPADHPDLASSLVTRAQWLLEAGRVAEAEETYSEAIGVLTVAGGPESQDLAEAIAAHGYTQHIQGRVAEAEGSYAEALRLYALPNVGPTDKTAETMSNLGWLLSAQGRLGESEEWMRRGYELRLERFGADHPYTASSLNGLAAVTGSQGRWESSLMLADRALRVRQAYFSPDHPSVGEAWIAVARAQRYLGQLSAAEASYRESIRITSAARGPRWAGLGLTWNDLSLVLRQMAQFREAEVAAREAMAIYSETRGERHLFTAIAAHNLASILAPLDEVEEAERLYRFSLEAKLQSGPANHPGIAQTRSALAGLLVDMGRYGEAEEELRQALDVQVPTLGRNHWQTGLSLVYLGETIEGLVGGGAGRALVAEGYEAVKAGLGPDDVETLSAEARLSRMLESEL